MSNQGPGLRIVIDGGNPTDVEVAAVSSVLAAVAAAQGPAPRPQTQAWARAARFEALGQASFNGSRDPRLGDRPTGALPPAADRPSFS